jgi:enterochelin esterase family protein
MKVAQVLFSSGVSAFAPDAGLAARGLLAPTAWRAKLSVAGSLASVLLVLSNAPAAVAAEPPRAGNFTIGPDYTVDPGVTDLGAPKGRTFQLKMKFADSKIFRGEDASLDKSRFPVRTERTITVYVPAGYRNGDKAPVMIMGDGIGDSSGLPPEEAKREQDREGRREVLWGRITNTIDNITASKDPARKVPAFVTVAVQNGGSDTKGSERNLEYDTVSDRYARFIHASA